ncbi:hypothetical protein ABZ605_02055 [Streptomyces sp. NPDC012765]
MRFEVLGPVTVRTDGGTRDDAFTAAFARGHSRPPEDQAERSSGGSRG